jgi:hypothetical protein
MDGPGFCSSPLLGKKKTIKITREEKKLPVQQKDKDEPR